MRACRFRPLVLGATLAASLYAALIATEGLQAQNKPAPPVTATSPILRVFSLRHASAPLVVRPLQQLLGGNDKETSAAGVKMRFWADQATNTLMVYGPAENQAVVETMIKTLDVAGAGEEMHGNEPHIIPLKRLKADEDLEKVLRLLSLGSPGQYALDKQRQAVILSGDKQMVFQTETVLEPPGEAERGPGRPGRGQRISCSRSLAGGRPGSRRFAFPGRSGGSQGRAQPIGDR